MNAWIETLNRWGESFLSFAWPMLWQSSLLIVVVFALDFLLARRIRASVRYALWMVVLVKLLLPPALALPTGATWWLWRAQPSAPIAPIVKNYTVSFDDTALPDNYVPSAPIVLPPPKLNDAGLAVLTVGSIDAALLIWLAFRWLRIAAKVRRAGDSPSPLPSPAGRGRIIRRCLETADNTIDSEFQCANSSGTSLLKEACESVGLRRRMRLKLIDEPLSPAVYGLFRPVILLPRALAEKLSHRQLRAVLLHEAIHLRRGDVWVNCAQALLQIAYWWHPLSWLANARIRRVREEAVDDAVMAALRDSSDAYAPTLLEVAKFAFRRPLASLGLVGILESRSALRQRIERLVDFRPPRRAGITFLSLCGIFVFSAIALPMGQGPAATTDSFSADMRPGEKTIAVKVDPQIFIRNLKAKADWVMASDTNDYGDILLDILNGEGVDFTVPHEIAFNRVTGEITARNTPDQLEIFQRVIEQLNRADGKYDLSSSSNRLHRKRVLIQGQFFWMTAEDLKKIVADATYHGSQGGSAVHWTVNAEQFDKVQERIKKLGLKLFMWPRVVTLHGCPADFYCGTSTNWVRFDCYPLVYDDGITLAFRAESDLVSMQDALAVTNRSAVDGKETMDNNGGLIVSAENPDGSPTNLVVLIHVKTVEETHAAGNNATQQKRLQAILQRVETNAGPASPVTELANRPLQNSTHENAAPNEVTSNSGTTQNAEENGITSQTESGLNQALAEEHKEAHMDLIAQANANQNIMTEVFQIEYRARNKNLKSLFQDAGVKIPPTIMVYVDKDSLLARGTADQLALVEQVVRKLNGAFPKPAPAMAPAGPGREAINRKLDRISLNASYKDLPLSEVIRDLHELSQQNDPDKTGINFFFNPNMENIPGRGGRGQSTVINPVTGLPVAAPAAAQPVDPTQINITLTLNNVSLVDLLNAICLVSDHPIKYSVEDYGVVFSEKGPDAPQYEMRTFKVDPNTFYSGLRNVSRAVVPVVNVAPGATQSTGGSGGSTVPGDPNAQVKSSGGLLYVTTPNLSSDVSAQAKQFFSDIGIDMAPPKTVYYNDRLGVLFVYASPQDLDVIERAIQVLNQAPTQIHIKAWFLEVPKTFFADAPPNCIPANMTNGLGLLTNPQFQFFLHYAESQKSTEELAEPEVTTISGRQTEMRATMMTTVVTNMAFKEEYPSNIVYPQVAQVEIGPILDTVPDVLSDGYTIRLQAFPSLIKFFGYAPPEGLPTQYATNSAGEKIPLATILPAFQVSEENATAKELYDGQTMVLFPRPEQMQPTPLHNMDTKREEIIAKFIQKAERQHEDKVLIALVTATLIDPAGNRVHSEKEMPFAQTDFPPQSP